MKTNDYEIILELLQCALGNRASLSHSLDTEQWVEIYEESKRQAIVGVVFCGLECIPIEQRPPRKIWLQWIYSTCMQESTYRKHCEEAVYLTREFDSAGFRSCVLKGVGAAQLYPKPERRKCGDIDLWVNGRREDLMLYLKNKCEVSHVEWHHIGVHLLDDVPVEVHVYPAWLYNPWYNCRLQRYFKRMTDAQMVEREDGLKYPDAAFNAVYSLTHCYHHFLEEGVGLRHVVDYYYVLLQLHGDSVCGNDYGSDILRTICQIGLGKFLGAMMWVLQDACGASEELLLCAPNPKEGLFLLDEIISAGNFGISRNDGLNRNTWSRWRLMMRHYPTEVIWMIPWKIWHRLWRRMHPVNKNN